jgi:hypothetical protein
MTTTSMKVGYGSPGSGRLPASAVSTTARTDQLAGVRRAAHRGRSTDQSLWESIEPKEQSMSLWFGLLAGRHFT